MFQLYHRDKNVTIAFSVFSFWPVLLTFMLRGNQTNISIVINTIWNIKPLTIFRTIGKKITDFETWCKGNSREWRRLTALWQYQMLCWPLTLALVLRNTDLSMQQQKTIQVISIYRRLTGVNVAFLCELLNSIPQNPWPILRVHSFRVTNVTLRRALA